MHLIKNQQIKAISNLSNNYLIDENHLINQLLEKANPGFEKRLNSWPLSWLRMCVDK